MLYHTSDWSYPQGRHLCFITCLIGLNHRHHCLTTHLIGLIEQGGILASYHRSDWFNSPGRHHYLLHHTCPYSVYARVSKTGCMFKDLYPLTDRTFQDFYLLIYLAIYIFCRFLCKNPYFKQLYMLWGFINLTCCLLT